MRKLEAITGKLAPVDKERFIELTYKDFDGEQKTVFVYPEPMKTKDGSVVRYLDFPEQLVLYRLATDVLGVPARHGSLRETAAAFRNPIAKEYNQRVLNPFWVYTGELAENKGKGKAEVRRALGARFVDEKWRKSGRPPSSVLMKDGKPISADLDNAEGEVIFHVQYVVKDVIQTSIATETGRFSGFKGVVPVDSEIKSEGDNSWNGTYFKDDFAAVEAGSHVGVQSLDAYASSPSNRDSGGVLPIFSSSKPKK